MSILDCGDWQAIPPKISDELNAVSQQCLADIAASSGCKIVAAGFIGSRMIGIYNQTSDYDIRAITTGTSTEVAISKNYEYGSFKIDIKAYPFERIASDIDRWRQIDKTYPSLHCIPKEPLVHNDVFRSQFRLVLQNPIYADGTFFRANKGVILDGILLCDQLDYDYIRAYMNYNKFLQGEEVHLRKYLYTFYEIASINWVLGRGTFCPDFIAGCAEYPFPPEITGIVTQMLEMNRGCVSKEKAFVKQNPLLNDYISETLLHLRERIENSCVKNMRHNHLHIPCIKHILGVL